MSLRRMVPFILINILVSAAVVLLILNWWEQRQQNNVISAAATVQVTAAIGEVATSLPVAGETEVPAPTQPAAPESAGNVHVVQPGETLGSISAQLDISMEDLVAANNLDNPDLLAVGQELIIPSAGESISELPEATTDAPPAVEGATTPQPIPTEPPGAGVVIVEITAVTGPGELNQELVSIANFGDSPVALQGWKVVDSAGREYTFGQVTLFGDGAAIMLHSAVGINGPTDLFWGLDEAVWESGETVSLLDQTGSVRASFVIP